MHKNAQKCTKNGQNCKGNAQKVENENLGFRYGSREASLDAFLTSLGYSCRTRKTVPEKF